MKPYRRTTRWLFDSRLYSAILFLSLLLLSPPSLARGATDGWEVIAPGIEFRQFRLSDPNNVFVARMERANPNVIIESSIGQGQLIGGTETVASMASRYDQTINYWGGSWGARNKVAVAINGYYFIPASGVPYQGQIHSAWYAKRFDDCETGSGGSGFAWRMDRSAFIGASVSHPQAKQFVTFANGGTQTFDGINIGRGANALILYTPQYSSTTGTDSSGAEVLVELTQPAFVSSAPITGYVREIRDKSSAVSIPFDHVVLSADGTARTTLLANVQIGDQIGISHKIKSYLAGCDSSPTGPDWDNTYASIGGAFYFLQNGAIRTFYDDLGAITRHPRTAIAFDDTHIFFIVVDGRDLSHSVGMTIEELALFARDTLGATYGIAEDGGGSSTMVINGEVKNNTFCNNVYCDAKIYLPMISNQGMGGTQGNGFQAIAEASLQAHWIAPVRELPGVSTFGGAVMEGVMRMVANGLMMVVVEPMEQSATLAAGRPVVASRPTEVRLGPGTNYAVLASVSTGTTGSILEHNLNGVLAKGSYWWKVELGGKVGWVAEESLAAADSFR